ncbi:MAG: peptidase M13, partial [Aldersonia sp.]|nr:peptidase M13 [Aldersonia sp.]
MTAQHSGIDLSHRNTSVRPQDDLFVHVNGGWLDEYKIPGDRAIDGAFRALYDQAEIDAQNIIKEAASAGAEKGTDTQKIGDLYTSFMNVEAVDAAGSTPIAAELDAVAAVQDRDSMAALLGKLQRVGIGGAVGHYVDTDDKNSARYLMHFTQSGIGLPDESYYRLDEHAQLRADYTAHIGRMFDLAGVDYDPAKVVELETKLAKGHWDVVKRRDAERSYNLVHFDSIVANA